MDDVQKEFVAKLYLRKREIEQALDQLAQNQKEYSDQKMSGQITDETDQAQYETSISNLYSLIERKIGDLKGINGLIRQISANGKFGLCEECGNRIPLERLMIVPEARLCVPCQRELEKFAHMRRPALKNSIDRRKPKPIEAEDTTDAWDDSEMDWQELDIELLD